MKLLTTELRNRLLENNSRARDQDHMPVVKFFLPGTACTWLFSEMEQDGDGPFSLYDLGQGEPELGYSSLNEISSLRYNGLAVERDLYWSAKGPLSAYARAARASGRIEQIGQRWIWNSPYAGAFLYQRFLLLTHLSGETL